MGHPTIEEFCRVSSPSDLRPEFFARCKRIFRDEVQPRLDERDTLLVENEELKKEVERLTAKAKKGVVAA